MSSSDDAERDRRAQPGERVRAQPPALGGVRRAASQQVAATSSATAGAIDARQPSASAQQTPASASRERWRPTAGDRVEREQQAGDQEGVPADDRRLVDAGTRQVVERRVGEGEHRDRQRDQEAGQRGEQPALDAIDEQHPGERLQAGEREHHVLVADAARARGTASSSPPAAAPAPAPSRGSSGRRTGWRPSTRAASTPGRTGSASRAAPPAARSRGAGGSARNPSARSSRNVR